MAIEEARFLKLHPKSGELFKKGKEVMAGGVPMSWMAKWPGAYPVFVDKAKGSRFTDVDGNEYVDLCLGDTGSMTGHSPKETVKAIRRQLKRGMTAMLPTEDALLVGRDLTARFGLPLWQFTVSATDANRHSIRYARLVTGKQKIIVIDKCYHGSVDETFATLDESGNTVKRDGNIGAPVPPGRPRCAARRPRLRLDRLARDQARRPLGRARRPGEFARGLRRGARHRCGRDRSRLGARARVGRGVLRPDAGALGAGVRGAGGGGRGDGGRGGRRDGRDGRQRATDATRDTPRDAPRCAHPSKPRITCT